jgi:hypothetical protein
MNYSKDLEINGQIYNYRFVIEGNSEYETVIITKDGLSCGSWPEINYDDLGLVCQDIMDYIKLERLSKFCVISENIDLFNIYKDYGVQLLEFYTAREREILAPIHYYASFYDII